MTKENFTRYAELKLQIASLEAQIEELQPLILAEMPDKPVELTDVGVFSVGSRKTWKYTDATELVREKLKSFEKVEQQTGAARFTEKPYLLFKPKK